MRRSLSALSQLHCLVFELKCMVNWRWWRWFTIWFSPSAGIIISYRFDRFCFLLIGPAWVFFRALFAPFALLLRIIIPIHEIHYRADIGKGLRILHPTLGVVISANTIAGDNLILTGGNCIGGRRPCSPGDILLGNNVFLGANAVVLGPIKIGDCCKIGAGAVVTRDAPANTVLVGIPAKAQTGQGDLEEFT